MSLINQVLKDLDKRGANTNIGEATIRVVHARKQNQALLLVAAGALGMLLAGGAVWMVWNSLHQPAVVMPVAAAVNTQVVVPVPVSQVVVAPVQTSLPKITSVNPSYLMATGIAQTLTLHGKNFKEGSTVNVHDDTGKVYASRHLLALAPSEIQLKINPGRKPANWLVEVLNAEGVSSGTISFEVKSSAVTPFQLVPAIGLESRGGKKITVQKKSVVAEKKLPVVIEADGISKQPTQISLKQQAENEFRRAYQLLREGRNSEALAGYENALKLDAGNDHARQSMVSLLLEKKRNSEAEVVLKEGLQNNVQQTGFAMLLARLQVERNALPLALETLQNSLPYAGKQADYQAFMAALMQRQNQHAEAVEFYRHALQLKPQSGVWLMGMGISLKAEQHKEEARESFKKALESNSLSTELQAYVSQQLKEL